MAGYNDPGHPAGLPSEPSPRRLPAGDGSGATAQMEGLQGPGSLQPGFRQCCFPNLREKMLDAKRTAGERRTHGQNGPNGKPTEGGKGEATRPKRKRRTKTGTRNPKKSRRNTKIARENAGAGSSLRSKSMKAKPSRSVIVDTSHKGITKPQ